MSSRSELSYSASDEVGRSANGIELGAVAAFDTAWETNAHPPEIAAYMPDERTLRVAALMELIRVDMRHRWLDPGRRASPIGEQPALRKRLIDYCAEFAELDVRSIPAGLVFEEFVIRRRSGERVDPWTYLQEYPHQADELSGLLNADDEGQSTRRAIPDDSSAMFAVPDRTVAQGNATVGVDETRDISDFTASIGTTPGIAETLDRIEIGQRIEDFDLLTNLGSGAFARVFLARQRSLQRMVAVKISADHGTEPQTLAQLDHDYIVRVFDQRLLAGANLGGASARRLRLLYMQFLPGGTLLGVLRRVRTTSSAERSGQLLLDAVDAAMEEKGEIRPTDSSVRAEIAALSWPETVAWLGRRLAEALEYAGARGVLHRDVKPANVLLTAEAVPKLADFNISFSRYVEGTSPVAYFGGSLSYMSPEQLEACHSRHHRDAADLDTRSDIYSLGVVLWELLTGAKPFDDSTADGGSDETTLEAMLERRRGGVQAQAQERVPPDCPPALRRVLLTCLAPEREARWDNGGLLAKQLHVCLDERARDLVDPPARSWRLRLRPWLIPVLVLAVGLPNAVASLYNIQHNQSLITSRLTEDAQRAFLVDRAVINAVFFPLGTAVIIYLSRYVISVPRGLRKGRSYDPQTLQRARADALALSERIVVVAVSLWTVSGITFPISLQLAAGQIPANAVVHFLVSLAVCGGIAVAYPFFLVTFYLVRSIYPVFLQHGDISTADVEWLRRLDQRCTGYLAIAASVPLLSVAGATLLPPTDIPAVIVAVRVVCIGGIVAFVAAYLLFRALEADLGALERVIDPSGVRLAADKRAKRGSTNHRLPLSRARWHFVAH
ncbi:serine/threonine-protein kinase [Nocardia vinacea]|uniref:serine/threonine-protein kinase n=1 Tax=Nocardia vinacea TaxID=96468 RepID=UPI003441D050